jgi:hypothetical protein
MKAVPPTNLRIGFPGLAKVTELAIARFGIMDLAGRRIRLFASLTRLH